MLWLSVGHYGHYGHNPRVVTVVTVVTGGLFLVTGHNPRVVTSHRRAICRPSKKGGKEDRKGGTVPPIHNPPGFSQITNSYLLHLHHHDNTPLNRLPKRLPPRRLPRSPQRRQRRRTNHPIHPSKCHFHPPHRRHDGLASSVAHCPSFVLVRWAGQFTGAIHCDIDGGCGRGEVDSEGGCETVGT